MVDWRMKRGDRLPPLESTLTDSEGAIVNLSTIDHLTFSLRSVDTDTLIIDEGAARKHATPATGIVYYDWTAGDVLLMDVGTYRGLWHAYDAAGLRQSYPGDDQYVIIGVYNDLQD